MVNYVPILRWKRGERIGLSNVSATTKPSVTPLIVLGPDHFKGKKPTASKPAVTPALHLAQEIANDWGSTAFYLDATAIPDPPTGVHAIVDIAIACGQLGLKMIPATRLGSSPAYQHGVLTVVAADKRGVALRTDLQGMTSASVWTPNWPFPVPDTDLLVDFADNIAAVSSLGATLNQAFASLHLGPTWRSVVSIGTSMPANFSGFMAGLHLIRRIELDLWTQLAAAGLPYAISYGDYATVPLAAPPPGIAWGYPINVKYTLKNEFLICRGVGTTGLGGVDMDQQLIGHAKAIVGYPNRGRIACWADDRVDAIAVTTEPPSGLEHWVRISVCRHIELTRANLP
ncbi:beta family protein [Tardiphaga sp. P5_C7]